MDIFRKITLCICLLISVGQNAFAADNFTYEEEDYRDPVIAQGIDVGLTYFLASKIVGEIPGGQFTVENVAINQALLPGLGARYVRIPVNGLGFTLGGRMEFIRPLSRNRVTRNGDSVQFIPDNAMLNVIVGEANLTYGVDRGYLFIGPNYSIPILYNAGGVQMQGSIGRQIGIGWATDWTVFDLIAEKRFTFEFFLQEVVFTAIDIVPGAGASRAPWEGMGLRGSLTF